MEPDFARRAPQRTSGDPEPGEGDFTRYAVEVTNLVHRATAEQVQELFRRLAGLCSVSYTPRSGKATVELSSRSNAETAVRLINTMRELAYSPSGKSWTLRARMLAIFARMESTLKPLDSILAFCEAAASPSTGQPGAPQQTTNIANISHRYRAGAGTAINVRFGFEKRRAQLAKRCTPQQIDQQQPVGFQQPSELRHQAWKIIHPMQHQAGKDIKTVRCKWQRLDIKHH